MTDVNEKTSPRDFFLNLLSIITLYMSATALGSLVFQYINLAFADPLKYGYAGHSLASMRFSIATLVVIFPVYVWSTRFLKKQYSAHPERKNVGARKWLVYFTLFAASIVIIGDLIALITNFLEGEITVRFALKALTVFSIAGSIFYYYISDVRGTASKFMKMFTYAVFVAVATAVFTGFFVVGSPGLERERKFDERRISDLQIIQSRVVVYWQEKGALPETLDDLKDNISGFAAPTDPETNASYTYRATGEESFELCATFNTESTGRGEYELPYDGIYETWEHDAGEMCFARTIDPDIYGNRKPIPIR